LVQDGEQAAQGTVPSEVVPFKQAVHVLVALLYPNPTLHEVQVKVAPRQVKQSLIQVAH
jgi:hypothetical protein